jgi:hypothetical protein
MQPKDNLSYWVCNPASGKCGFGNVTLVESGLPQLKVFVDNMPNVNLTYYVLVDGTKVAGPVANHFSTGWLSFSGSPTVAVTENATSPAFFTPEFIAGCDPNGNIALKPGGQPDLHDLEYCGHRLRRRPALLLESHLELRMRLGMPCAGGRLRTTMPEVGGKMLRRNPLQRTMRRHLRESSRSIVPMKGVGAAAPTRGHRIIRNEVSDGILFSWVLVGNPYVLASTTA